MLFTFVIRVENGEHFSLLYLGSSTSIALFVQAGNTDSDKQKQNPREIEMVSVKDFLLRLLELFNKT